MSSTHAINITINGHEATLDASMSVIQAAWQANIQLVEGVGCLEGVCGSCRIMVRRSQSDTVEMALACQTLIEDGMHVLFLGYSNQDHHSYQLSDIHSSWEAHTEFHRFFPEAKNCRGCGGCVQSCPKGIDVKRGVELAAAGKFRKAGELFLECIMCGFCTTGCPERIAPNHVGLFCRRVTAYFHSRPSNLINRLEKIRQGTLKVTIEARDQ